MVPARLTQRRSVHDATRASPYGQHSSRAEEGPRRCARDSVCWSVWRKRASSTRPGYRPARSTSWPSSSCSRICSRWDRGPDQAARPENWTDRAAFDAAWETGDSAASNLSTVTSVDGFVPALETLAAACRSCHKKYITLFCSQPKSSCGPCGILVE
jgi:hypothetical protein